MKLLGISLLAVVVICAKTCFGVNYVAEGLFIVDEKALELYMREIPGTGSFDSKRAQAVSNIRKDADYLLAEANKLLTTLAVNGVNLEIRVRANTILATNIFSSSVLQSGNVIEETTGLQQFGQWLINQNAYSQYNYDFAVLMTGYDIYGGTGANIIATSYVGTVCNPTTALSLVEFNGTYQTAVAQAREIVHLLGGSNDGEASNKIMATFTYPEQTGRWDFSQCSATDIKESIAALGSSNCLLQTNTNSIKPATTWSSYSGELFNKDVICQRYLNDSRSYACLSSSLYQNAPPKGDTVCRYIYCSIPGTTYCKPAYTSEGFICDRSKRCGRGTCQPDTSPASANIDPTCVLGDQKWVQVVGANPVNGSCPYILSHSGVSICYSVSIAQVCCATCKSRKSQIAGCEYGDKNVQCTTVGKITACAAQNRATCCATCNGYTFVGKRSTDKGRNVTIIGAGFGDVQEREYTIKHDSKPIHTL